MKYLLTFGLGAVAPWVAAVVLHRHSQKKNALDVAPSYGGFASRLTP